MASSSSNSPCAACKFLRRKCQPECVFAPYFPPDQPQKFANVHKVFGASNVTKLLNELLPSQREDAVNSLAYEADMRLRDPVYGCVGVISLLQHQLRQLQMDLSCAKSELSKYQNLGIAGSGNLFSSISTMRLLRKSAILHVAGMESVVDFGMWLMKSKLMEMELARSVVTETIRHTFFELTDGAMMTRNMRLEVSFAHLGMEGVV